MKSWDVIVLGCGVIGASLARELHKSGMRVLVIERGEPGGEASHAAAGMLAPHGGDLAPALSELAVASAEMYPEFVRELEDEAAAKPYEWHAPSVDLRCQGTILVGEEGRTAPGAKHLDAAELMQLEPRLASLTAQSWFIPECSVDPQGLMAALLRSLKHRGVELAHGSAATRVARSKDGSLEVETEKTSYIGRKVVNCCGAWAGGIASDFRVPAVPRKGQMLSVLPLAQPGTAVPRSPRNTLLLKHVIRSKEIYLVPRTDGRILIGATVEDAGFDKQIEPAVIQQLKNLAERLAPEIANAKIHESWAGLRPGTPDDLPILGESNIPGYFIATGHFRNGILLAPVTAVIIARLLRGDAAGYSLKAFSPARFG